MMEPMAVQGVETVKQYPSLSDRVQSSFIDGMIIIVLMFACSAILDQYEHIPAWIRAALFASLWIMYEPLATTLGATVGNYIKGIRVRKSHDTYQRINFFQALLRYILKLSLGWISFLTIHTNMQRRAIHDLAAGSVMIVK